VYDRHAEDLSETDVMVTAFALKDFSTATSIRGDLITD
jgi:hypothetical protein